MSASGNSALGVRSCNLPLQQFIHKQAAEMVVTDTHCGRNLALSHVATHFKKLTYKKVKQIEALYAKAALQFHPSSIKIHLPEWPVRVQHLLLQLGKANPGG